MNDVNLTSPELKLVRSTEQTPARAMSSSQDQGASALVSSPSSAARVEQALSVSQGAEASGSEELKKQSGAQREGLDDAVSQLNDYIQKVQRDLQFEVNSDLGATVVRVVDQQTQEVIRQIPDEVAMRLAENLQQEEPLTLFNLKV